MPQLPFVTNLILFLAALALVAAQSKYPIPPLEVTAPNTWGRAIFKKHWVDPNSLKPVPCRQPVGRYGHTLLLRAAEASLYLFGGLDGRGQFLNDLWKFKLSPSALECDWQELYSPQSLADQYSSRDTSPTTPTRRGIVPGQPSGRAGHTATLSNVTMADGRTREVMTILGGYGPNCSDYCRDFWHYDFRDNRFVVQYMEYWSKFGDWSAMVNYSKSLEKLPEKRWRHSAIAHDNRLYVYGGHGEPLSTNPRPCCGHSCGFDALGRPRPATAEPGCGFYGDLWSTLLTEYEPFLSILSIGKHVVQSSTDYGSSAILAIDGVKTEVNPLSGSSSVSKTLVERSPWWQMDLGDSNFVSNISIWNVEGLQGNKLSNFYVLLSEQPFLTTLLQDLLKDPAVWKFHVPYSVTNQIYIFPLQMARFVRVQLVGTDALAIAELQVWGYPPIQSWQHFEGPRRWNQHFSGMELGDSPKGRMSAPLVKLGNKAYLFGGYTKESPVYLSDYWVLDLIKISWEKVVPTVQLPRVAPPVGRYGHIMLGIPDLQTIIMFGGQSGLQRKNFSLSMKTSAEVATNFISGFSNEIWAWNVTSNSIGLLNVESSDTRPIIPVRTDAAAVIWGDYLIVFGGLTNETHWCPDAWFLNAEQKTMTAKQLKEDLSFLPSQHSGICSDMWIFQLLGSDSCPSACNQKGKCVLSKCECFDGFWGESCDQLKCPGDVCIYDYKNRRQVCHQCCGGRSPCVEDRGKCNGVTASCECKLGFTGENCDVLKCPTDVAVPSHNCSGHGACKIGGICDCELHFQPPTCFVKNCPNNCSKKGDCLRSISTKFGEEIQSVSATCICGDTFDGESCEKDAVDLVIERAKSTLAAARASAAVVWVWLIAACYFLALMM